MMLRAEEEEPKRLLVGQSLQQRAGEPRFPNAGFPRQQDYPALAIDSLRPAVQQQRELRLPSDQWRQRGPMLCLKAALNRACTKYLPRLYWIGQTLQRHATQVAVLEHATRK